MEQWTRKHDAHIAEKCEGLEVFFFADDNPHEMRDGAPYRPVSTYNLDIAACIRAAEAWRTKDQVSRWWKVESPMIGNLFSAYAIGEQWHEYWGQEADTLSAALAWALYRATERLKALDKNGRIA